MRKVFLLLVAVILLGSCSLGDDNGTKFHTELLPIESADLPDEFKNDSIYELPFTYVRPSTCHLFEGFYYAKDANIRTIAIHTSVIEQGGCTTPTVNPITEKLQFRPSSSYTSYIFKLWKGEDSNGVDVFEEVEIPVVP
ncbi:MULTISPECIES: hypothetical protein [unclassified Flavobacterium]|uniref:hypothetical protein n=1 Tax=unclassified Flavobacterium TaxID=196869 RepID=UPI00361D008D